jgi:sugar phosphate isomerase/epimerase
MAVPTAPIVTSPPTGNGDRVGAPLGLDQPVGSWPTTPRLKSYEAAGFRYLQVRMPPRALLSTDELVLAHASALRDALRLTGLQLILHAPDDLLAGTDEHDRQLDGALRYAALAGAEMLVYHGARVAIGEARVRDRLADEERSLRRALRRECASHNPGAVADLIDRLDSEHARMCLDLGHAHIVAGLAGCELVELVEPVLEHVILFHVHDNFGADARAQRAGAIEPVRLDLHLAPGAGTVPWPALAPLLAGHPAPLQLEIHPARRPAPATLAILTRELLGVPSSGRIPGPSQTCP